ncbi:MAG: FGGY-family carbohydrate kinase [Carnobacterium sp.]|uniref:FGGY-family carbohydrate kinase n=1 Tax=unclassified Carnobacterium TaxID=257487 RepID=UPI00191414BB|nr:FGGY-family carbohydrate kinase [Carnobacterium sp. CS13]QQP69849.1 FGGY-family carbohydrate kinase [Carnobacterium sp. CS13]
MNYLIGTDIGTSGTKSILMDTKGNLLAQDLIEYDVLTPKALWAEQWPDVWSEAVKKTIRNVVLKANVDSKKVKGIGISGLYGGSGIPLDKEMKPVRPCLIWMDRRATKETEWVAETIGKERLQKITANGVDPYYGFTKMLWIKNNEPENWEKIDLFLPPNHHAIYELTGEIAIDYSSAGNIGGIFDMNTHTWSEELMQDMGIPLEMMPQRLVDSTEIVGGLTAEIAAELGLEPDTPVISGGVDAGAANIGMGIFEPGVYAAAIGTSMCAALVEEEVIKNQDLIVWPYPYNSKKLSYNFSGGATAGGITKWFRDNFAQLEMEVEKNGGTNAYELLNRGAEKIPAGSEGLIVLPYFMGERSPVWNQDAKGTIFGLSLAHTKAHIYRAFMEAVAYSLRHTIESVGRDLGEYIIIAGGVTKSALWKQIFADVTGYPIVTPINDTEANLGDVMMAGIATGEVGIEDVKKWQVLNEKIMPNPDNKRLYDEYYGLYRKLYTDLEEDMSILSDLADRY